MIVSLHGHQKDEYPQLFDAMFQMRARAFFDRRGWQVEVTDGREYDRFDELNPLYIMGLSEDGELVASLRLLQTTGPHMLSDVFPETLGDGEAIRHPLVWESTRFCVDTKRAATPAAGGIHRVTGELLTGLFETAYENGIQHVVSVYDMFMERVLRRAGCVFDRLGPVHKYDGLSTVAGVFEVSPEAIASIRSAGHVVGPVLCDAASALSARKVRKVPENRINLATTSLQ